MKQGELNIDEAGNPVAGVEAGEVPQVSIEVHATGKKKGRKKKTEVA